MINQKIKKYLDFEERCKKCKKCALRKTATQVVVGDGIVNSEIMLIGEAPGKNEDIQGIPFCGAAGKFLNELLKEAGIKRENVYISNILKCRPPNNRDPLDFEIECCRAWLDEQINIINPKILVLLGRFAMGKFFPNFKISQAHGKAFKKEGKIYFIMFHPAVALYNGSYRQVLIDDFKKIKKIINSKIILEKTDKELPLKKVTKKKNDNQFKMEL